MSRPQPRTLAKSDNLLSDIVASELVGSVASYGNVRANMPECVGKEGMALWDEDTTKLCKRVRRSASMSTNINNHSCLPFSVRLPAFTFP